jgi:hypothetical protein
VKATFDGHRLHVDEEAARLVVGTWPREANFELVLQALLGFDQADKLIALTKQFPLTSGPWDQYAAPWLRGVEIVKDLGPHKYAAGWTDLCRVCGEPADAPDHGGL